MPEINLDDLDDLIARVREHYGDEELAIVMAPATHVLFSEACNQPAVEVWPKPVSEYDGLPVFKGWYAPPDTIFIVPLVSLFDPTKFICPLDPEEE